MYTAVNDRWDIIPVYLDFSKTFATMNEEVLCGKLYVYDTMMLSNQKLRWEVTFKGETADVSLL